MRTVIQQYGRDLAFPRRVLCDSCAPDQDGVRACAFVYCVFMFGVLAFISWIIFQIMTLR
jgi:hypothetical protein